ncbi:MULTISPECIES: MFS transporter [Streptomycetaceae]|uniref:Integral membrane efflux protein n=1 Tax=Streptantibioticus cattleyicolor (strain ATCC 35852 / DSM 46488 / JCM 4925 / NBRC 14057 / NRRL 8057) TaxID=1003195 RepID=F8K0F0_STREN|nr:MULTISPECIES: MFS transporter [Streptomycetaceae]AEW97355.1 integral membrane efflux protein [Streptantibioticus cattleyicolor NRRL 8057 = DSM 46488]MYS61804.1 MFS transporter [Streptomyces sp. SID5468]CCB77677.1 putative Major facilitator superfamily MFS_1 [Streptantibioticus cattleyicolor NRRL 8057 = DSM 46488]
MTDGTAAPTAHGTTDTPPDARPPRLFASRNPRLYYAGLVFSQVGTNTQLVALGWFTYQLSHDALVLGVVSAAPILTMLLLSQAGGVVADRFPPRRVLLCTHSLLAVLTLLLGLLAHSGSLRVWHLVVSALCVGGVNAIGLPTEQVFVSEVAGDALLKKAVTLNNVVLNLSLVVGSSVAGPLMGAVGLGGVVLLNAGSYLVMLTALLLVRPAQLHARPRQPGRRPRVRGAWGYVRHSPGLTLLLLVIGIVGLFGTSLPSLLLLLCSGELAARAGAYGILLAVVSVGSLIGALLTWRTKVVLSTVLGSSLLLGVLELVTAAMPSLPTLGVVLLPVGVVSLVLRAGLLSLAQLQTLPEFRGRVMAVFQLVYRTGWFLGTLIATWLARTLGPRPAIALGGAAVTLLVAVVVVVMTAFRAMSVSLVARRVPRVSFALAPEPEGRHRRTPRHMAADT